jgi:hypothetical protein
MTARETNRKGNPPGIEASRESQTKLECRPDKFERGGRGGDPYRYFFAPDWDSNHVQQAGSERGLESSSSRSGAEQALVRLRMRRLCRGLFQNKHAFLEIFPSPGGWPHAALVGLSFPAHHRSAARRDHKKLGHPCATTPTPGSEIAAGVMRNILPDRRA